ncbi:hypothetical protein, partial [Colwellia sp. E2M01]|uniref:hypothetical protein n=1 Tax=Colwellia sp. E2M01 TaxID=2841561 RepID=UPI001C092387
MESIGNKSDKKKLVKVIKATLPLLALMGAGAAVASTRNRSGLSSIRSIKNISAIAITKPDKTQNELQQQSSKVKRAAFGAFTNASKNNIDTAKINIDQNALDFLQKNDLLTVKESVSAKLSGNIVGRKTFVDFCLQVNLGGGTLAPNSALSPTPTVTDQANVMKSHLNKAACNGANHIWHTTTGGHCSGGGPASIAGCMNASLYWQGINVIGTDSGTDTAPVATSVSFSGTLQVGELLTSNYTYTDTDSDAETTSTFKWYASNDASGTGKTQIATTENFTLTGAQAGKYISFEVTPVNTNASGTPVESAINSTAVAAADSAPTASSVSFSGTLQAGELLTSSYTYADVDSDAETTSTFKWYASNDASGTGKTQIATTENFTLTGAQAGKYISFEVTPVNTNASGTPVESAINSTAVAAADSAPTASSVSFSGTLQAGELLTSSYTYADVDSDAETTSTFKWYASNDASGTGKTQVATTENFTLTGAQVGKYISFEVTPVNANASGTPVESAINSTVVTPSNTAPVISGSPTLSVAEDAAYSFTPTVTDDDTGDTTTFSITNKPSW